MGIGGEVKSLGQSPWKHTPLLGPGTSPAWFMLTPASPSTLPAPEGCPPMLPSSRVQADLHSQVSLLPPPYRHPLPLSPLDLSGRSSLSRPLWPLWILVPLPHLWPPGALASLLHFSVLLRAAAAWLASCSNTAQAQAELGSPGWQDPTLERVEQTTLRHSSLVPRPPHSIRDAP